MQGTVTPGMVWCEGPEDCRAELMYSAPGSHPDTMSFTFQYRVFDGTSTSAYGTVTFSVGNCLPSARSYDGLLADDTRPTTVPLWGQGEAPLTFVTVGNPLHGTLGTPSAAVCKELNLAWLTWALRRGKARTRSRIAPDRHGEGRRPSPERQGWRRR